MSGWVYLALAGLLETAWAILLKASNGFARPGLAAAATAVAALSLYLLAVALRQLPTSIAYSTWVGIGVAGVALYEAVIEGQPLGALKIVSIALIIAGIAGLSWAPR